MLRALAAPLRSPCRALPVSLRRTQAQAHLGVAVNAALKRSVPIADLHVDGSEHDAVASCVPNQPGWRTETHRPRVQQTGNKCGRPRSVIRP
jgi:hypothetical protein